MSHRTEGISQAERVQSVNNSLSFLTSKQSVLKGNQSIQFFPSLLPTCNGEKSLIPSKNLVNDSLLQLSKTDFRFNSLSFNSGDDDDGRSRDGVLVVLDYTTILSYGMKTIRQS
jgi:hypothetical protein